MTTIPTSPDAPPDWPAGMTAGTRVTGGRPDSPFTGTATSVRDDGRIVVLVDGGEQTAQPHQYLSWEGKLSWEAQQAAASAEEAALAVQEREGRAYADFAAERDARLVDAPRTSWDKVDLAAILAGSLEED